MEKSLWVGLVILFLTASTLSGCLWVPYDDGGGRRGGSHERDRGDHRGERYDRHEDRGDR